MQSWQWNVKTKTIVENQHFNPCSLRHCAYAVFQEVHAEGRLHTLTVSQVSFAVMSTRSLCSGYVGSSYWCQNGYDEEGFVCVPSRAAERGYIKLDCVTQLIWHLSLLHFGFSLFPKGQHCHDGLQLFNKAHRRIYVISECKSSQDCQGMMFTLGETA